VTAVEITFHQFILKFSFLVKQTLNLSVLNAVGVLCNNDVAYKLHFDGVCKGKLLSNGQLF
jgi:hypothetical protein